MVARSSHAEDVVLRRLLEDRLPPQRESKLTAHIERCEDCQSRLEAMSEEHVCLEDVQRFLAPADVTEQPAESVQADDRAAVEQAVSFLSPSDDPAFVGRFGRFDIDGVLGSGGMGVVLKAYDAQLKRYVAIKVLAPTLATSAAARRRFAREAQSAAAVVHRHVVPIHSVGEEAGLPFFIMPLIDGESLEQRVSRTGPLQLTEILRIGMQTAAGLAAAHEQGLVHRDVKPGNILLEHGVERVLITDFGLARTVDEASVTRSGVIAGTPQYMSPEQAHGDAVEHRSDLFSLGSVLYFMCTGRSPFRANTTMGVLQRIATDAPRPIRQINPEIPEWLEAVVLRLLAKEPSERFQSSQDVSQRLSRWLAHLQNPATAPEPQCDTPTPQPQQVATRPNRPVLRLLALAAGAIALLAGVVVLVQLGETTVRFEIDDPDLAVHFGEKEITIVDDGEKIQIRPGEDQSFVVTQNGTETAGYTFRLVRGSKAVLRASVVDEKVQLSSIPEGIAKRTKGGAGAPKQHAATEQTKSNLKLTRRLRGHDGNIRCLAVSPDGRYAASGGGWPSGQRVVRLWDLTSGEVLWQHTTGGPFQWLEFTPDNRHLGCAGAGGTVYLLNVEDGSRVRSFKAQGGWINVLDFTPDGEKMVTGSGGNRFQPMLEVWDVETGQRERTLGQPGDGRALGLEVSPDGRTLLATSEDVVHLWNLTSGQLQHSLSAFEGQELRVGCFSHDGNWVLAGGDESSLHLWDLTSSPITSRIIGRHRGPVLDAAFTSDDRHIVSSGHDGKIRVWDVERGGEVASAEHEKGLSVWQVEVASVGRFLSGGGSDYRSPAGEADEDDYAVHVWRFPEKNGTE